MYKLPKLVIRYWLLVHSKKQTALAMNHELITHNQLGFAPIALVILLLFGIAAGTLLVQNGVNFLPKAQTSSQECSENIVNTVQPCNKFGNTHPYKNCSVDFAYCNISSAYSTTGTVTSNDLAACKRSPLSKKFFCNITAEPGSCILIGIKDPDTNQDSRLKENETWIGCDTQKNRVLYLCKGNDELSVDIKESNSKECQSAPVAAAPAAGIPEAIGCKNEKDINTCKDQKSIGCYEIGGKPRCVFDQISCTDKETAYCQGGEDKRLGCEVKNVIIKGVNDGKPLQHTQCTEAKLGTGAPARPAAPAPAQPAQPVAARPAAPAQPAAAAPLECGFDKDDLSIPCYQIGVFKTLEDLVATEAQAKVNVERYKGYRTILDQVKSEVDKKILDAASAKLAEAEKAANACIGQK